jgi:hypothetical protein
VAPVVALLLSALRLRRSPPACPRTGRLRRYRSSPGSSPRGQSKYRSTSRAGGAGLIKTKTTAAYCPTLASPRRLCRGSGRRFAPLCATAATLPALLPTNWPASSLALLSGQFAQRTRQKPLDVSGRGGKVPTKPECRQHFVPSPSISSRQTLAKKARTGHCLRWYCEIKIPALSLHRTQGEGRGTPLIFSFSSCLTRGVHFSGQFAQRTESKASGQECPLHTIQVWFVDGGRRGL